MNATGITRLFAVAVTATAISMAGVAAWDRGGTLLDRALMVVLSATICAATHLLPALSRRPAAWIVWLGCLVGALYGHLTFFTHAGIRASQERAQAAFADSGIYAQAQASREALESIQARSVTRIANELARVKTETRRFAIEAELGEAKRAAALHDRMVGLAEKAASSREHAEADPVISRLAAVTGSSETKIGLISSLWFAVLVELIGAVLWWEALREFPETSDTIDDDTTLPDLHEAIKAGECKATVAGIRDYLRCSQAKALDLRRQLA